MAVNAINNQIKFPGFSTTLQATAKALPEPAKMPEVAVQNPVELKAQPDYKSENKSGMSDNSKYMLGAAAIAVAAIATILITRNGKAAEKFAETVSSESSKTDEIIPKAYEDKFMQRLLKLKPEFEVENDIVTTFKSGVKRIDQMLFDAGIKRSIFQRKDGSEFARVDWSDDGDVFKYIVKDSKNRIVKDFSHTTDDYVTKVRYNKEDELISRFESNLEGWDRWQTFEKDNMVSEIVKINGVDQSKL